MKLADTTTEWQVGDPVRYGSYKGTVREVFRKNGRLYLRANGRHGRGVTWGVTTEAKEFKRA